MGVNASFDTDFLGTLLLLNNLGSGEGIDEGVLSAPSIFKVFDPPLDLDLPRETDLVLDVDDLPCNVDIDLLALADSVVLEFASLRGGVLKTLDVVDLGVIVSLCCVDMGVLALTDFGALASLLITESCVHAGAVAGVNFPRETSLPLGLGGNVTSVVVELGVPPRLNLVLGADPSRSVGVDLMLPGSLALEIAFDVLSHCALVLEVDLPRTGRVGTDAESS